ncbi:MAG: hypothetical protein HYR56_20380 [Acidobacteria bacterium]|nr:hypothetical protein [Acidobacteriota bacterium]MBI3423262.1 hypothetical protein [Acidobacteriota bacterium]
MKVAFGLKAHSGWAALIVLGEDADGCVIVERRRIELVDDEWAKQPYHAAENLPLADARDLVTRGVAAAQRIALRELRAMLKREHARKNEVCGCAVLTANPMPDWNIAEILAVHFRMHKAEGVLFREALAHAAESCGLKLVAIPEKSLTQYAEQSFGASADSLLRQIAALGKAAGPPWGKDQKDAALAALVALYRR